MARPNRRRVGGILAIMGIVTIAGVLLVHHVGRKKQGALYEGRPVEEWLHDYYRSNDPASLERNYLALKALRAESIPLLAEAWIDAYRSSVFDRIEKMVRDRTDVLPPRPTDGAVQALSKFALQTFDVDTGELLPRATELFENAWLSQGRNTAFSVLQFAQTNHSACLPLLIRAYESSDEEAGEVASELITRWDDFAPDELLPHLEKFIARNRGDYHSMDNSLMVLARYGFSASNSIPAIRARFDSVTDYSKVHYAYMLFLIDPEDKVGEAFLMDQLRDVKRPFHELAYVMLLRCGPDQARVAEPLWELLQTLAPDGEHYRKFVEILVRLQAPREELFGLLAAQMSELPPAALGRLNAAKLTLELDPDDEMAWRVMREFLFADTQNDPSNGAVMHVGTAMEYMLKVSIEPSTKVSLLEEVIEFHAQQTRKAEHVREQAGKHLVAIDPSKRPGDFQELVELYLD